MGRPQSLKNGLAVAGGGMLLLWPAFLNGYPILFSDTGGLLSQGLEPEIGWDKPWAYGPFLLALCLRTTLWLPVAMQAVAVSHVLWLVQKALGRCAWWRHTALCAGLAGTAAPWFASLLMPDIFAPVAALCLFLLAYGDRLSRLERGWVLALGAFAIAVHLSHLVVAAACLAVVLLLRPRRLAVCAAPLGLALGLLLVTNWVGNGVLGVSPFGSVFALARLQADGPAADYLRMACPAAGYRLCAWSHEMPMDSDKFLWDPNGPIWGNDSGPTLIAAETARIVRETVQAYPLAILELGVGNTLRQLGRVRLGDALSSDYLDLTVLPRLVKFLPAAEAVRFKASLQDHDALASMAAQWAGLHLALLVVGNFATLGVLALAWRRRDSVMGGFAAIVLVGVLANACATGALSGPHDRYQARIAWLVLLPPVLAMANAPGLRRVKAGTAGANHVR